MSRAHDHPKIADSLAQKRRRYTAKLHPEVVVDLYERVNDGTITIELASLIADILGPGEWREQAACRGANVDLFFPDGMGAPGLAEARKICRSCPVRQSCFDYAQEAPELDGVWGGFSTRSRRQHPAGRKRPSTAAPSKFNRPNNVCVDCLVELGTDNSVRCHRCKQKASIVRHARSAQKYADRYGWRDVHGRDRQAAS